jgi:hypothetical protein
MTLNIGTLSGIIDLDYPERLRVPKRRTTNAQDLVMIDRTYILFFKIVGVVQGACQVLTYRLTDSLALTRVRQPTFALGRFSLAKSGRYCPLRTPGYWRLLATLSGSTLWIYSTHPRHFFSPTWILTVRIIWLPTLTSSDLVAFSSYFLQSFNQGSRRDMANASCRIFSRYAARHQG